MESVNPLNTSMTISDWKALMDWGSSPSETINFTSVRIVPESYRLDFASKSFFEISFAIFSSLVNMLIVLAIAFHRKFRKRTNYLIANLCLASLMYNAVLIYRHLEYKMNYDLDYENGYLCGIFAVLHRYPFPVMSMTTMAISLDRSKSATATIPIQLLPSKTWTALKIVLIWTMSLLLTLPTAFINTYGTRAMVTSQRKCKKVLLVNTSVHLVYVAVHVTVVFVVPAVVLVVELIRMRSKIKFLIFRQPEITSRTDERLRLVRNACLFTAVFIVFWLPIGLHATVYDLPEEIVSTEWKLKHLVSGKNMQFITHYFIFSIPIALFTLSHRLRESLCGYIQETNPFPLTSYLCYLYYCCNGSRTRADSLELSKI